MDLESPHDYFGRPDVVSEYASFEFLLPPEKTILEELRSQLSNARMLDIGVGAGRTTGHFAPLVREYVGIDISPSMIEACRRRFSETLRNATFAVFDARDLGRFDSASFDFVLFSFNGIDTVGDRIDRLRALGEIHRLCRFGATFCFSSSNLSFALSQSSILANLWRSFLSRPTAALRHPRLLRKAVAESRRWKRPNPALGELGARGEGMIVEDRRRFEFDEHFYASPHERIRVEKYYIEPRKQIEQLEEVGFGGVRVFEPDGDEFRWRRGARLSRWWWLYYLCTRSGAPSGE